MYRRPIATCRRGHAKDLGGHCKQCDRVTYKRRAAARRADGLTARGRPRYSLRTHCPNGHLRSENEVPRSKTSRYSYCRLCNRESSRKWRQRTKSSRSANERGATSSSRGVSK